MKRLVTFELGEQREGVNVWYVKAQGCPMVPRRACTGGIRKPVDGTEPEMGDLLIACCEHTTPEEKSLGLDGVYQECRFPGPAIVFATSIEAANGFDDGSAAQD